MENIFEKGILIHLHIGIWTGKVQLPKNAIKIDADPEFISAVKYLVDRDCLKPIEKVRNEARNYIYNKSLPFPIPGVLFIPKDLISTVDKKLQDLKNVFDNRVNEFINQYEIFVNIAKTKLNSLFNPLDYPKNIRNHFDFEWKFFNLSTSGNLQLISPELYEREKEKFIKTIENFQDMAVLTLRESFREMLDRIVDRLSGEGKIFRNSTITNLQEFISDFKALNINNDKELESLIEKCKAVLSGVDPDIIREDKKFRQAIAMSMESIQNELSKLMVTKPKRRIKI